MEAIVYSKDNCPYCVKAKHLLEKHGIVYTELNAVDHLQDLVKLVESAGKPRPQSVPQIFLDDEYIGGYDQLASRLGNVPSE